MSNGAHLISRRTEQVSLPNFFLFQRESRYRRIRSNLAACMAGPPQMVPSRGGVSSPMFRSAYLRKSYPLRSVLVSALLHVGFLAGLIHFPGFPPSAPRWKSEPSAEGPKARRIIWYSKANLLPPISPTKEEPKAGKKAESRSPSVRLRAALNPLQELASKQPAPDNRRQTIIQPESAPLQIRTEIQVPNLVSWSPQLVPPPPAESEARRPLPQIRVPALPKPTVPVIKPMPAPPKLVGLRAMGFEVPVVPASKMEVPKLPVPVRVRIAATAPPPPPPAPKQQIAQAPIPLAPEIRPETTPAILPNLVAVSIAPPPPQEEILIPPGNRAGEFMATPEGNGNDSPPVVSPQQAQGEAAGSDGSPELRGRELAEVRVPGLSVTRGNPAGPLAPVVESSRSPVPAGDDLRRFLARATRPSLVPEMPRGQPMESEFFGGRHVYTVYLNMPNLSSGSGSWVLRFAELGSNGRPEGNGDALATPEAIRKVDPMYVPSAVRDKVQGAVTLAALVLRDGSVANIRVVRSLDPRLDTSAVAALTQWQFHPATRNGVAVDLEVLVQIPFQLPAF